MANTAEIGRGCVVMATNPLYAPLPTPTITAIVPVKGNPTRWTIRVGKKRVATLAEHEVADLNLHVGTHWSEELAERVRLTIERRKARTKALRMLGRRACTHGEIVAGLTKASFSTDIAREVADELVEQGWIDEAQIAIEAARDLSNRHMVHEAIAEKLRARHLDEHVANDAASAALADVDTIACAARLINQKLATLRGAPTERDVRKILGALSRKGFEFDDVVAAFQKHGIDLHAFVERPD